MLHKEQLTEHVKTRTNSNQHFQIINKHHYHHVNQFDMDIIHTNIFMVINHQKIQKIHMVINKQRNHVNQRYLDQHILDNLWLQQLQIL